MIVEDNRVSFLFYFFIWLILPFKTEAKGRDRAYSSASSSFPELPVPKQGVTGIGKALSFDQGCK